MRRNKFRGLVAASLFIVLFATLYGCAASKKYGRLTPEKSVQQSFQSYEILPNHKYYFRGVYSRPTVIVGINQRYQMNLKMWVKIDPESKDFKTLIDRVNFQGLGNPIEPWGLRILDQEGNQVGIWYSALLGAAVEVNENRQIVKLHPIGQAAQGPQRK